MGVLGLVHHTHAPAAQLLKDAVVRDGRTDHVPSALANSNKERAQPRSPVGTVFAVVAADGAVAAWVATYVEHNCRRIMFLQPLTWLRRHRGREPYFLGGANRASVTPPNGQRRVRYGLPLIRHQSPKSSTTPPHSALPHHTS